MIRGMRMNENISITKEEAKNLNLMAQKLREYINLIGKDEKEIEALNIAVASQFFLYSFEGTNNRFMKTDLDYFSEKASEFLANIHSCIIETKDED